MQSEITFFRRGTLIKELDLVTLKKRSFVFLWKPSEQIPRQPGATLCLVTRCYVNAYVGHTLAPLKVRDKKMCKHNDRSIRSLSRNLHSKGVFINVLLGGSFSCSHSLIRSFRAPHSACVGCMGFPRAFA
jgi:hypothetical protein